VGSPPASRATLFAENGVTFDKEAADKIREANAE